MAKFLAFGLAQAISLAYVCVYVRSTYTRVYPYVNAYAPLPLTFRCKIGV